MALISKNDIKKSFRVEFSKSRLTESVNIFAEDVLNKASRFYTWEDYDIFLSHSYQDKEDIVGIYYYLSDFGFKVYVDWLEDPQLDRSRISKRTAEVLRARMQLCKCLLYAHSENSKNSRWVPWELGYMDSEKGRVAILPIVEGTSKADVYRGQEYLSLYPYIATGLIEGQDVFALWVHDAEKKYVALKKWLEGKQPTVRP